MKLNLSTIKNATMLRNFKKMPQCSETKRKKNLTNNLLAGDRIGAKSTVGVYPSSTNITVYPEYHFR